LGIALENYQMAHRTLPPGCVDPNRPVQSTPQGYHVGWLVQILPQLDQENAFHHFDFTRGVYAKANQAVPQIGLSMLRCPSDPAATSREVTSYAGCHHDAEAPIDIDQNGVLHLNSSVRNEQILDGVSNTLFVGEKVIEPGELSWTSGTRATLRNAGSPINTQSTFTITGSYPGAGNPRYVGGFGSHHARGMHFLVGDGSVRFLNGIMPTLVHPADGAMNVDF
ncbi:MAG: DUF1559 domain-containing protein, partial [Planctomycetaceae bacterium]